MEHVQGSCGLFMKAGSAQMTGVFKGCRAPAHKSFQRVSSRRVEESVHGVQVTTPGGMLPTRMQDLILTSAATIDGQTVVMDMQLQMPPLAPSQRRNIDTQQRTQQRTQQCAPRKGF